MKAIKNSHPALLSRCFDFSPPEGWGSIIVILLDDIASILFDARVPDGVFNIRQIKEKFGELRVYSDGYPCEPTPIGTGFDIDEGNEADRPSPLPTSWHFERIGTIDFDIHVNDETMTRVLAGVASNAYLPKLVARKIRQRIDDAKDEASRTCQICGGTGHGHIDGGWHLTVCTTHRDRRARQAWWEAQGRA